MAAAHDQLRQRLAFAWSQILVVSDRDSYVQAYHKGAANYYDMLSRHADGSFRQLLEDVSYHPIMGTHLSHLKSAKAKLDTEGRVLVSPDENFARELLQLFSIGLTEIHLDGSTKLALDGNPIPTYENSDILELSRVFTGLSFSMYAIYNAETNDYVLHENTSFTRYNGDRHHSQTFEHPMKIFGDNHDPDPKFFLGAEINNTNITDLAERGVQDIEDTLDTISQHPNVAPFICRRLIQRLVTSNPSAGYLYRVSLTFEDNGEGVRGDLKAVTKAILLDPDARNLGRTTESGYGKLKEPLIRYVSLLRAFEGHSQLPLADLTVYGYPTNQLDNFAANTTRLRFGDTTTALGQSPLSAPSVFNWFEPDYADGGALQIAGLKAPEFQIASESAVIDTVNFHNSICRGSTGQGTTPLPGADGGSYADHVMLDFGSMIELYDVAITNGVSHAEAVSSLVDHIDTLLMCGSFKRQYEHAPEPNPRSMVIEAVLPISETEAQIRDMLYLMSTCVDFNIQK